MIRKPFLDRTQCALALALVFLAATQRPVVAQLQSPWTGVVRDDAEQAAGAAAGFSVVRQRALSADARFLVFDSDRTLVPGDTNGTFDAFLRDRQTGGLQRVSVATDGTEGNNFSGEPSISANGRHVVFRSLASNFDSTDTNGVPDIYVRDLDTGTTTLVSVGPQGQRITVNYGTVSVARPSGDGRFVAFTANFNTADGLAAWLRDRDADEDGVFDEPGEMTTTLVSPRSIGDTDFIVEVNAVAISNDSRYVAFGASTVDATNTLIGFRMFLHDRLQQTTIRVDTPLPSSGDVYALSRDPDLSDSGELVYTSNAPNLVPDDADTFSDVFVYDTATASQTRLQLTHRQAEFVESFGAAVSADGRYVAFTGYEIGPMGEEIYNVYAIDREAQASYDISVNTDGGRDNASVGASISADGGSIAFTGSPAILQEGILVGGVYVATSVEISAAETLVPPEGGVFPVDVSVPAGIAWTAKLITGTRNDYGEAATYTGVGPSTIDVEIPANNSSEGMEYQLWLGSKAVAFHQPLVPVLYFLYPDQGPAAGGTPFTVSGSGYQPGATVTFDGVPATDSVVSEYGDLIEGLTPPHVHGGVNVVVTNPDGASSVDEQYFYFIDETPPVIASSITGPLGANGWYTGNVSVQWTVTEDESQLWELECDNVEQTTDVSSRVVTCHANSDGGDAIDQVEIKRDATAPAISITQPQPGVYSQGESVAIDMACADVTSGVSSCVANQSGNLKTSAPGAFAFTVTATDAAGNQSTRTVSYTVTALATLDASPAAGAYGGSAALNARLATAGAPLANRTVTFYVDGTAVATAITSANGDASAVVSLAGRHAGSLALRAEFSGDASTTAAVSNTTTLTIAKALLRVVTANAVKVYGQALPSFSAFGEGFVSGDGFPSLAGSLVFMTAATATSAPGAYPVTPSGVSSSDYNITFVAGTLTINKAATSLALTSSPNPSHSNQNVVVTATVAAIAPGAGAPTGIVEFRDNGVVLGTAPVVNGVASLTKKFKKGSHTLTAAYAGDGNFNGGNASIAHEGE